MLQQLRAKFMGWPGVIIFGSLGILMAIGFGVGSYSVSNQETWVAKVGKHEIATQDYQTQMNNMRRQMSEQQGSQFDASYFEKPAVKQQILDNMVDRYLLQQSGNKIGLVVTPTMVRQRIASTPTFQVGGKFDPDTYRSVLTNNGLTPTGYQQQVQSELQTRLLPETIMSTSTLGPQDVENYLKLRMQTRDLKYVIVPRPALTDSHVSDSEVSAYYKAHQAQFMIPERVAVNYIELGAAGIDMGEPVDDATLKARYAQEKNRFVQPEQRQVSHILISVPSNATPEQQKAALAKAKKVDTMAQAKGGDFASLAKKYSDDAGSSIQGGKLGWLQPGVTAKAFDDALFSMHKGEISDPVLGPAGYHIIWLRNIRAGKIKPFAEVRKQLLAEVQKTGRAKQYSKIAGKLTDLAYENPSSLDPAAKKLGLKIQSTGLFSRDGTKDGLASNPDVVKAAFSKSVLKGGNSSDPIKLGPSRIAVVHVTQHKPATPEPMKTAGATIRQKILDERVDKTARKHADALLAKLKKDGGLDKLAQAENLPVRKLQAAQRVQQGISSALLDEAFKMPHPTKGKPGVALTDLGDGSFALLSLEAVHPGDVDKIPQAQRQALLTQMRQAYGTVATQAWLSEIKQQTDIKIAKDRM